MTTQRGADDEGPRDHEDQHPDYARGQEHDEIDTTGPDFARGQRQGEPDVHRGDFAEGQEDPEHREPTGHGDFARGQRHEDPGPR